MNASQQQLARRLVDHPAWRWLPGMRWIASREAPLDDVIGRVGDLMSEPYPGAVPDFDDDATKGCLLALAREAWGDPGLSCVTASYSGGVYLRRIVDGHYHGSTFAVMTRLTHATEGEAIAHAILGAPKGTTT